MNIAFRYCIAAALLLGITISGVRIFRQPSLNSQPSYWNLAGVATAAEFQSAVDKLDVLTPQTGPDSVKSLRISILRARDCLDTFSFAYPYSAPGAVARTRKEGLVSRPDLDVWYELRLDLDTGYEFIGSFQDLDHSGVDFNDKDLKERRAKCLEWKDGFLSNMDRYNYMAFVSSPGRRKLYQHGYLSRLFWGYNHVRPFPGLSGLRNVAYMMRYSQLQQTMDTYDNVIALPSVLEEPAHTTFHDFRKVVRSMLAVFELFPEISRAAGATHNTTAAVSSDAATVHEQPVSSSRSMRVKSATTNKDYPGKRRLAADTQVATGTAAMQTFATSHAQVNDVESDMDVVQLKAASVSGQRSDDDPSSTIASQLQYLFKNLGQVNNKAIAYDFYKNKGDTTAMNQAAQECNEAWKHLQAWIQDVRLREQLTKLSRNLEAFIAGGKLGS